MSKIEAWQRLDNSAIIFPVMVTKRRQNNFRMQITLEENVDKAVLSGAVSTALARYPQFNVSLVSGAIWHYFIRNDRPVTVTDAEDTLMAPLPIFGKDRRPFRFSVSGNKIYADFFHALGDGTGIMEFLKTVLYAYITAIGKDLGDVSDKVLLPSSQVDPEEYEDGFVKYYKPTKLKDLAISQMKGHRAFLIEGEAIEDNGKGYSQYVLDSKSVIDLCHAKGCTVTEYLGGVFAMAIYDAYIRGKRLKRRQLKDIQLFLPINLRRQFPSRTLKNFSLFSRVGFGTKDELTLNKCIGIIHESLIRDTQKDLLHKKIITISRAQNLKVMKIIPLCLKKAIIRFSNIFFGRAKKTATFSNVGITKLPESMRPYVRNMQYSIWPSGTATYSMVANSVWDVLNVSLVKSIQDSKIEEQFEKQLEKDGLSFTVSRSVWAGAERKAVKARSAAVSESNI